MRHYSFRKTVLALAVCFSVSAAVFFTAAGHARATPDTQTDFERDVAQAQNTIATDNAAQANQTEVTDEDTALGWDSKGTNVVADGEQPIASIMLTIQGDIASDSAQQAQYATSEASYLQMTSSTPQQVIQEEQVVGTEAPPEQPGAATSTPSAGEDQSAVDQSASDQNPPDQSTVDQNADQSNIDQTTAGDTATTTVDVTAATSTASVSSEFTATTSTTTSPDAASSTTPEYPVDPQTTAPSETPSPDASQP